MEHYNSIEETTAETSSTRNSSLSVESPFEAFFKITEGKILNEPWHDLSRHNSICTQPNSIVGTRHNSLVKSPFSIMQPNSKVVTRQNTVHKFQYGNMQPNSRVGTRHNSVDKSPFSIMQPNSIVGTRHNSVDKSPCGNVWRKGTPNMSPRTSIGHAKDRRNILRRYQSDICWTEVPSNKRKLSKKSSNC